MDFIPIRTATIRGNQKLFFNLYLKIRDREVLYIRENDPIEEERLEKLKDKKVRKVFIEADSEPNYLKYLEVNLKRIEDQNISIEERSSIIEGQAKTAVEDLFDKPESKQTYDYSKNIVDKYVGFMADNDNAVGQLLNLQDYDFDSYQHSINVSSLAIGLAIQNGETKKSVLENLGMGALLHDIGKTKLNINPAKPLEEYNEKEMEDLKKHPRVGEEILKSAGFANHEIIKYVLQHEEYIDGSGYPQGLRGSQLDFFTQYISLANTYDRYITFYKLQPKEAMKKITIDKVGLFKLEQINNLKKLLHSQGVIT